MFPPFDEGKAAAVLSRVVRMIAQGDILAERAPGESAERRGKGFMLGALVCACPDGSEVALVAPSGISWRLVPKTKDESVVFVPPVVDASRVGAALEENDAAIHEITRALKSLKARREAGAQEEIVRLESERKRLCAVSLSRVFSLYSFCCADGKTRTMADVCRARRRLPPTGTGDCAAPKLLHHAFLNALRPLSLAETPFRAGVRPSWDGSVPLEPPCDARCAIVLPEMLTLSIVYRDRDIIVVDKQPGLLSVPGRGPCKQDCVVSRVRRLFPGCIEQPAVHRLDMETSGLMVLAFSKEAHRALSRQFEERLVQKEYVALLDGNLPARGVAKSGVLELYFRLDLENRPRQIWDRERGKKAVTEWSVVGVERHGLPGGSARNVTRVLFVPKTGRTHQLRLASSDGHGFGVPIVGDTLYGTCAEGGRLMLHARKLSFLHPVTGERMEFFRESAF